ncbi:MAG: EAL domain-containing protein [Burkholderiales bacterium]
MGGSEARFTLGGESYHALVELSPDAIFVHKDGKLVFSNQAGADLAGAKNPSEIIGRPISEFFPAEQNWLIAQRVAEMLATGKPAPRMEFTVRRLDGTEISMEASAGPIKAFGGTAVQVIARDVTARKHAEEALRVSEEHSRQLAGRIEYARQMLETQKRLIESVASGKSPEEIFIGACKSVESIVAGARAAIFLLDRKQGTLRNVASPSLPVRFRDNSQSVPLDARQVPCGLAAETGRPVVVADFVSETRWRPYLDRIGAYKLRAEWVVPMFSSGGDLLGTLVVYHRQPAQPTDETVAFLKEIGHIVGIELEKQRIASRLERSRELHRVVVTGLAEGVVVIDADDRVLMANPAAYRILRLEGMRIQGEVVEPKKLFQGTVDENGDDLPFERWPYVMALRTGRPQRDVLVGVVAKNGEMIWASCNAIPMSRVDGAPPDMVVLSFQDVTGVRDAESRLHFLANHDVLTRLPNRVQLQEQLEGAIERARRHREQVGVLFIDLDRFKDINDNLGHEIGDRLLCEASARLRHCMRQADTVARHGGDEFVVLTEELEAGESLCAVAERIIAALSAPYRLDRHELFVGASVGIAVYPRDGTDAQALFRNADVAMYQAKTRGGSGYEFFTADLNDRARRRFALETGLRRALEREEFSLVFQPRARVADGRIIGVEALLRWNSPEHGTIMPADFIPLLEYSGLIVPVGRWVLEQACAVVAGWKTQGLGDLNLAVNVSARQLRNDTLIDDVNAALAHSGLPARKLELELTESMITGDSRETERLFGALNELGVELAIDDFGTGYSSLAYLRRFPIDRLKIDRSFTAGVPESRHAVEITQTIIAMARALGMESVAEGVETEAQLEFLRTCGCDEYQGFLLARPMPAQDFETFIHSLDA